MGPQTSLKYGVAWQNDRAPPKRSRYAHQIVIIKLLILSNLFQIESKTIVKIRYFSCYQYKIRTSKQLSQ